MNWRFTIIDRNNVATVIDEPLGWDDNVSEIKRHPDWHGIFFTNQGDEFQFDGLAMEIIKAEKEQYGVEGNLTLVMEEDCGNGYEEFSRGRFDFNKYESNCGDECYVKIPVENTGDITNLTSRIDQKVNLEATKAFDEVTDLTPYDKLPFSLSLPSKGIFMQDAAEWSEEETTTVNLQSVYWEGPTHVNALDSAYVWFQIVPQFDKVVFSEFGEFATAQAPEHTPIKSQWYSDADDPRFTTIVNGNMSTAPDTRRLFFNWASATPLLVNDNNGNSFDSIKSFSLKIDYSFDISIRPKYIDQWTNNIISLYNVVMIRRKNGGTEYLAKERIISGQSGSFDGYDPTTIWKNGETHTVSFSGVFDQVSLNDGDYLFVTVIGLATSTVGMIGGDYDIYDIVSKSGSVQMETLSHFQTTLAKVFAINETLSRIAESITNDKLRAYSQYFGRTDSQPYAVAADGCGALEAITDGLRIRNQENKIPDQTSVFSVSLQDVFNGLNPIHNIGIGVEPDPNRIGFNRMRVEPWHFFYNTAVILNCTGVNKITHKTNDKEIYSIFSFGYNTWEAEEYNGLDEFLTKRGYRTTLSRVKNDFSQISPFIASGYALEITRRKGNTSSSDWRYDNNTFIICLKRGSTASFLISFNSGNSFSVAVFGDDFSFVQEFFSIGSILTISSGLNSGTFTVTANSVIPGNLSVTVAEATVGELAVAAVTNNRELSVELGNIASPKNIVDPDTIYNFRISPVRNAMRWMNKVLESYENFSTDSKIIFTDGEANYFASGEIANGICQLENAPIAENVTIDPSIFADTNDCRPFMKADRVTFDYPMSSKDYKTVESNPYGLIYFENDCEEGLGWIDTISYKPEDGLATFTLIPVANVDPTGCVPVAVRGDGTLPSGLINTPYSAIINLYGTAPFELSNIVKPSWLTINVSGTTVYLSGTPSDVSVSTISFDISNCDDNNNASFNSSITIGASTCDAVAISGTPALPDGFVNTFYNYLFAVSGDGPFTLSNIVKPSWMTISVSGSNIVFSGVPSADATGVAVSFDINNCSGANSVSFSDTFDITTVCVPVIFSDGIVLPDAQVNVAYLFSFELSGTAPFALTDIVKPDWMTIEIGVNTVLFSGTPDAIASDVTVSFTVGNCTSNSVPFAGSINVVGAPAGALVLQTNDTDNDNQNILDLIDSDTIGVEYLGDGKVTFHIIKIDGGDANG